MTLKNFNCRSALLVLSHKNIHFNTNGEAIKRMQSGVNKLATVLGVTLGPKGRNVVLYGDVGAPRIVNDGVTVARDVELVDPVENVGARLVRQAAIKTNEDAGDGTTTATILSAALINEGIKIISAGVNPTEIVKGIEMSTQKLVDSLTTMSIKLRSDQDILDIASVSAGNNKEIGKMILNAISKVGRSGVVTIQESKTTEDGLTVVEGMQLDRGYYSPYFVTNADKMLAEYENCRVLLVDKNITSAQEIIGQLEASIKTGYPLLILAENIEQEALAILIVNRLRSSLKVVAVKAPGFGDRKTQYLEDIAILTGGTLIKGDLGIPLEKTDHSFLGKAAKVTVSKNTCTLVGDGSQLNAIKARVRQIKMLLKSTDSEFDREKLLERIARLTSGISIISVGAQTETELKDRKLRVEDALCATRAAVAEGFVPGGGCTLFKLSNELDDVLSDTENEEQKLGVYIVKKALMYPQRIIAANAGVHGEVVELKISDNTENTNLGYNAATDTYDDLVASGIIDPTKVIRCAIENASSVARTFMLAGAVITEIPKQHKPLTADASIVQEQIY